MNKVELAGRLTKDPDARWSGEGEDATCVARFALAVDRRTKKNNKQEADFPSCVCFGKTAQFAEKYLQQGMKIIVVGRIMTGSYVNQAGTKVYTTDVVADEIEFCEKKEQKPQQEGGFMDMQDDEDLPFNM